MTKNGIFCVMLCVILAALGLVSAVASDAVRGWLGIWLGLVSLLTVPCATFAGFIAACDYLAENEE